MSRIFGEKRSKPQNVFWPCTTQNLLTLALYCVAYTVNKLLKCIWELRNISKDNKIIIMKTGMLQKC